jgi:hypothetical protein
MKKVAILAVMAVMILLFSSCTENKKSKASKIEVSKTTENFDWLLGNWKRNNEEAGKETFEVWEKTSNSEYIGLGFTMQNGDTIKQEKIKLIKLNGKWDMEVKVPEEAESIIFKMSEFDKNEFTCVNEVLDFPNKIKYWRNGDKINALVSGGDMEIPFEFEKIIEK